MEHNERTRSLESRIRLLISCLSGDRLPPVTTLCEVLGEGRRPVLSALRVMRERGELEFGRGQGIRIRGRGGEHDQALGSRPESSTRLYEELKQRLLDGEYRAGDRLPKREYYVLERHISSHTVTKAMRKLADDGFVHRRGKAWIAGRPPRVKPQRQGRAPVILIVQNSRRRWRGYKNERTGKFVDRFSAEALRFGFALQPFFVASTDPGVSQPYGSAENLFGYAESLEHLFFGSLILGDPGSYDDFDEVLGRLVGGRKPVVWLDTEEKARALDAAGRNFYHCHFSEEAMADAAVRHLISYGHRTFCYVDIGRTDWSIRRKRHLAQAAARHKGVRMLDFWDLYRALSESDLATTHQYLQRRYADGAAAVRKMIRFIAREYGHQVGSDTALGHAAMDDVARFFLNRPVMLESSYKRLRSVRESLTVFLDGRSTAIVFSRDLAARGESAALSIAGVTVPGDISLLSFDNLYGPMELKVNTVDNGADHLGYAAFHAIAGTAPVKRTGEVGALVARPRVVDCGSVADIAAT